MTNNTTDSGSGTQTRAPQVDLDAYFARIGYQGRRDATLETLRAIHLLHPQTIPFENLDPLMHRPVPLDLDSLQQKLVLGFRGGYCYEQNTLLSHVLGRLGFRITSLAARVMWNNPEDHVSPRNHMLLRVTLEDGDYIADAGFGGLTQTGPLRLEADHVQVTPHGSYRLLADGDGFRLQARLHTQWKTLYRFDLTPQFPIDHEVANHFVATYPDSLFRKSLMLARVLPAGRYALLNNRLTLYGAEGDAERLNVSSAAEFHDILKNLFGVALPDRAELDAALTRIVLM